MIKMFWCLLSMAFFLCCVDNQQKNKIPSVKRSDSCRSFIQEFAYPEDLNIDTSLLCFEDIKTGWAENFEQFFVGNIKDYPRPELFFYFNSSTDNTFISTTFVKRGLKGLLPNTDSLTFTLTTKFYDGNFGLFSYQRDTKLLYDRRNNITLCFKRSMDYANFTSESIYKIYLLDKQLMPMFSINREEDNKFSCRQYYYDDRHYELYSKLYDKSGIKISDFTKLDYSSILSVFKKMQLGVMPLTEKQETHLSAYFKKVPLWVEN